MRVSLVSSRTDVTLPHPSTLWEAVQHWSVRTCSAELAPHAVCEVVEVSPRPFLLRSQPQRGKHYREYRSRSAFSVRFSGCAALLPIRRSFGESRSPLVAKRSPVLALSIPQPVLRYTTASGHE